MSDVTTAELIDLIAERTGVSRATIDQVLDGQAEAIESHAKLGVPISRIGVIKLIPHKPKSMKMKFGPRAGETVSIPMPARLPFKFTKPGRRAICLAPEIDAGEP